MMMGLVLLLVECFGKLRLVRQELSADIDIVAAGTVAVV
jgi:hypothetical protein